MDKQTRGIINGIVSGISFGLIPLFSIPVIAAGMGNVCILVYRFLFGSIAMLGMLMLRKTDMRISISELLRIIVLSAFYIGTSLATLECYHYLSSGIATALVYTDPIWCAIIGLLFLGDKFSLKLTSSIILATVGVMMMTGVFTEDGTFSALGLFWGLMSGLSYALYLIFVPRLNLKRIPSLKLTFYGIRDIVGGRSGSYESVLIEAKETSMKEMVERAQRLGANAIVGIDIDYETVGQNGSMLMVATSGTAVVID